MAKRDVCVKFASPKMSEMVYKHLGKTEMTHMVSFIDSKISGIHESIKGNFFETFMHEYMVNGCSLQVCLYGSKSESVESVNFRKLSTTFFTTQIEGKDGMYCRPRSKNMQGINSMLLPDKAFQMAVQTRRTFPLKSVVSLMTELSLKKKELKFYYVVPRIIFNDFKCQKNLFQTI